MKTMARPDNQMFLLLRLRWPRFVNSLRHGGRRAELGMQAIWFFFAALFVLASSAGFFLGTFGLLRIGREDLLDLLLWAVFLVWQLAPVLFEGYSPGLNFREVGRFPHSVRLYFFLSAFIRLAHPVLI